MVHIPDGMLSATVIASTGATSAGFVGYAVAWVRRNLPGERVVLMAVMAAMIFALQMLNFPVAGGTSGHFAGGAAAAILLSPWPAVIVMTTVLLVQALIFADGGVLALGANVFNLGVVGVLAGYLVWRVFALAQSRRLRVVGAFAAGWVGCLSSALAAGLEIWLSGRADIGMILGAMAFWHALIGVGEGAITAGLVAYLLSVRPDLVERAGSGRSPVRGIAVGLGVVALAAAGLSFAASRHPDGLEFAYFERRIGTPLAPTQTLSSPIPDYLVPGISNEALAGVLAGIVGVVITGVFVFATASAVRRRGGSAGSS